MSTVPPWIAREVGMSADDSDPLARSYVGSYGEYHSAPKYRVEVRSDEDGGVDEVLLHDDGRCLMHLERMDKDSWWMGLYPENSHDCWGAPSDAHFDIFRDRKRVEVEQR